MQTIGRFRAQPERTHASGQRAMRAAGVFERTAANGQFLLRIEDLDAMRCPRSFADLIMDDLRWLGLDWDGEVPYQSERSDIYAQYEAGAARKGAAVSLFLFACSAACRVCAAFVGWACIVRRYLP